ncbi:MAG: ABC transporter ATP-binding protein, partial [Bdellovibrionota bacterium]
NLARFDRINQWYTEAQIGTVRVFALFQPSITVFAGIALSLVIYHGGQATLIGSLKPGVLVAFFAYVQSMFQPMREIADKWNIFLSAMASAERVFSVLEWPVELRDEETKAPARPLVGVQGHLIFENVWFAYEDEKWILRDFNLEIYPGSKVGIVGHTGAGKTTLIALLMRLYEPQKGRILLDGKDLKEYDRRSLRATFGVVQQDAFLFSGTFKDNITFWAADPSHENASGFFKVSALLTRLGLEKWWGPQGSGQPELHLQERGANLSIGEKQVLGFSRALYSDPKVWILDEATSNMDSGSEHELEQALDNAAQGDTMIMVAHRLATVRRADTIVVLNKGVLIEKGNHTELLNQNGLYARLHRYQVAQAKQAESQNV